MAPAVLSAVRQRPVSTSLLLRRLQAWSVVQLPSPQQQRQGAVLNVIPPHQSFTGHPSAVYGVYHASRISGLVFVHAFLGACAHARIG